MGADWCLELDVVTNSGLQVLEGVITGITHRAQAELSAEAKPRVRFMLDSIADLKGNKKKLVKVNPLVDCFGRSNLFNFLGLNAHVLTVTVL